MKKKIEFLNNTEINLEDFYVVSIYQYKIKMQGKISTTIFRTYKNMGFDFQADASNGFFSATKMFGNIAVEITLTLP
jgi:hypothetical protein